MAMHTRILSFNLIETIESCMRPISVMHFVSILNVWNKRTITMFNIYMYIPCVIRMIKWGSEEAWGKCASVKRIINVRNLIMPNVRCCAALLSICFWKHQKVGEMVAPRKRYWNVSHDRSWHLLKLLDLLCRLDIDVAMGMGKNWRIQNLQLDVVYHLNE